MTGEVALALPAAIPAAATMPMWQLIALVFGIGIVIYAVATYGAPYLDKAKRGIESAESIALGLERAIPGIKQIGGYEQLTEKLLPLLKTVVQTAERIVGKKKDDPDNQAARMELACHLLAKWGGVEYDKLDAVQKEAVKDALEMGITFAGLSSKIPAGDWPFRGGGDAVETPPQV